jgi:hypothetical protein
MNDQNKKTLRQFQCRDYLWEIFEQMSGELECSVDYLINEAMRQYARSRNYGSRSGAEPTGQTALPSGTPAAPAARNSSSGGMPAAPPAPAAAPPRMPSQPQIPSAPPAAPRPGYPPPSFGAPPPSNPGYPAPPPRSSPGAYPAPPAQGGGYPAPPAYGQPQQGGYPAPPASPGYGGGYPAPSSYPPPPTQRPPAMPGGPPPLRASMPQAPAMPEMGGMGAIPAGMPTLFVIFNGQKYPVQKEEFIIGRGNKTADLPIKDGNISRRHAAIIFQNGGFYMKDLGSTNGIEYQGRRVDTRRIEEGDVYQLCDYELRCTYR